MFDMSRETDVSVTLYSRKVMIMAKANTVLPKWLRFVKGEGKAVIKNSSLISYDCFQKYTYYYLLLSIYPSVHTFRMLYDNFSYIGWIFLKTSYIHIVTKNWREVCFDSDKFYLSVPVMWLFSKFTISCVGPCRNFFSRVNGYRRVHSVLLLQLKISIVERIHFGFPHWLTWFGGALRSRFGCNL